MKTNPEQVSRYAEMFSAIGTEARLRIMQLLLSAHPEGMVVGEIQTEIGIPGSTLSHHLDKLKNEGLVRVRRESTFLWYTARTDALQELLGFLYAECCTRNKAVHPGTIAAFGDDDPCSNGLSVMPNDRTTFTCDCDLPPALAKLVSD